MKKIGNKITSFLLVAAIIITGIPADRISASPSNEATKANEKQASNDTVESDKICELTFNDEDNPLNAGNAVALICEYVKRLS